MFPLFTTRCLHVRHDVRDPSGGSGNCGRECCPGNFAEMTTSTPFRDLLHAANLRHGTDGFTSSPKEGVMRIFFALKSPTALAGFELAKLGTKGQHATPRPPKPMLLYYGPVNLLNSGLSAGVYPISAIRLRAFIVISNLWIPRGKAELKLSGPLSLSLHANCGTA